MVVRVNGSTGIITVSGTSGAPSLRGPDGNSGISFDGDQVIISSSGLVAATFSDSAATINNLSVDTTTFEFSPGSSGTPTIAASGDLNTGIYFPAADTIGFAEGGNEAARIDDSGRVLIGTNTARRRFFNADGEIPTLQIEGTGVGTRGLHHLSLTSNNTSTSEGAGAFAVFGRSRGGVGDYTVVNDGDAIGSLSFQGADGTDLVEAARITALVDGTPGANDMPGRLVFSTTADGASSPTEAMRITSGQRLRVGMADFGADVSSSNRGFEVQANGIILTSQPSTATQSHHLFYNPNGTVGSIQTNGSSTSFNTSSDYRLKENVVPLTGAADRLNQLQVHRFNFIADPDTTVDGFLAHEAQAVVPECVTGTQDEVDDDGNPVYQGIDQSKLVPLLTAALQEALAKIETLEAANASLEARLTALESA